MGTSSVSLGAASLDNDLGAGLRLEAGAQLHATDVRLRVGAELAVRSEGAAIQLDRVDVLHGGGNHVIWICIWRRDQKQLRQLS